MANSALCRQVEANTAFPMSLTEMVLITGVFCKMELFSKAALAPSAGKNWYSQLCATLVSAGLGFQSWALSAEGEASRTSQERHFSVLVICGRRGEG